jgi:hypothetical protein
MELNRNYVRSVDEPDVTWFDANLAVDFFNTNDRQQPHDMKSQGGHGGGSCRNLPDFARVYAFAVHTLGRP